MHHVHGWLARRPAALLALVAALLLARTTFAAGLTLSRGPLSLLVFLGAIPTVFARAFGARFDGGQRDAPPVLVDIDHPDLDYVAHGHLVVRVADKAVGQAANVDQAALGQANVDKGAKIDHADHNAF